MFQLFLIAIAVGAFIVLGFVYFPDVLNTLGLILVVGVAFFAIRSKRAYCRAKSFGSRLTDFQKGLVMSLASAESLSSTLVKIFIRLKKVGNTN